MIWITGSGIISAIGVGKEATLSSLLNSHSGIAPLHYLQTEHHEFPVGEVKLSNVEMCRRLQISDSVPMTRTALMGMMALDEALRDAKLDASSLSEVGIVSGTTVGGMDKSEQYYLDFLSNDSRNEYIRTHDCGACTDMIADHFGRFAFATTLSTACSSAANAIILGANAIRNGDAECVVVGGSESLTKFHLNGFNSLMILDRQCCRPFDAQRAGLNLGEGAAFLVLETESHARRRGVSPQAVLSGYGNACDAFHQTASSPDGEGAYRAMYTALQMAHLKPDQIDYINAHGTGTPNNDASESAAVRRIWGDTYPKTSSTKTFTGHTTSASGAIEAVICLLAMQHNFIPANLHYGQPDDACLRPVSETLTEQRLCHVLCNSFGFGGNDTSIVLSQPGISSAWGESNREVYICAAEQISVQSSDADIWMRESVALTESYNRSTDPTFSQYIPPIEARRMGKILKRAVVTSKRALQHSGLSSVDAVITGTGLGCIENTEYFLDALCRDGEQMLKPTHFMQSTHNTIGSLVAIREKCHGYNVTYAHKELSFDSALYDAWLQIAGGRIESALVGGHDEMTPSYFQLLAKVGFLGQPGQSAGETAVSFVLSHALPQQGTPMCQLVGIRLMMSPTEAELSRELAYLLRLAGLTMQDIDGVMLSVNGNVAHDEIYWQHYHSLFGELPPLRYKHLFGDSYTASGLGLYAAACCLQKGLIPEALVMAEHPQSIMRPHAILLYNATDGKEASLALLKKINSGL